MLNTARPTKAFHNIMLSSKSWFLFLLSNQKIDKGFKISPFIFDLTRFNNISFWRWQWLWNHFDFHPRMNNCSMIVSNWSVLFSTCTFLYFFFIPLYIWIIIVYLFLPMCLFFYLSLSFHLHTSQCLFLYFLKPSHSTL